MRTATVTWIYYENFGTFLQAYALQKSIKKLGHENIIIDDSYFFKPGMLSRIKKTMMDKIRGKSNKTHRCYADFRKRFLNIGHSAGNTDRFANSYDVFLCGSDQIWSPYLEFNPYYYLSFTEKKKVAYAPSIGTIAFTEQYKENIKAVIEKFDYISVREEDSARILSTFLNREVNVVLDPTLLLTQKQWDCVESKIEVYEPYILCYFLTPNKWYIDYVKEYALRHNKKIKIFNISPLYEKLGFEVVNAGPGEFISYIKNADKVFTDSFHSSIFSILYHKDFITFKRFKDGGEKDQNARIANLFNKLGIEEYFIGENQLDIIESLALPNYLAVEEKLGKLRAESKEYLRNAIEN